MEDELKITEQLLSERQMVIDAIPLCPVHGTNCVSHCLNWVEKVKTNMACAIDDLETAAEADPTNEAIKNALKSLKQIIL